MTIRPASGPIFPILPYIVEVAPYFPKVVLCALYFQQYHQINKLTPNKLLNQISFLVPKSQAAIVVVRNVSCLSFLNARSVGFHAKKYFRIILYT